MTMNILQSNGSMATRCAVTPLVTADFNMPDVKRQQFIFDNLIRKRHGDSMNLPLCVKDTAKLKNRCIVLSFLTKMI